MTEPLKQVTSSNTVKQIDEAIAIWPKVAKNSNSTETIIKHLQESRLKLIGILQQEYNAFFSKDLTEFKGLTPEKQEENRNIYKTKLVNLMRDSYKPLSLSELENIKTSYLKNYQSRGESDLNKDLKSGDLLETAFNFFENKTNINMMTVVKSSLSVAAIALMSKAGGFSLIGTVMSGLWTFCWPIAICAGIVGLAGLSKLIGKVFGPELKAFANSVRSKNAFRIESDKNLAESFDANSIIEEFDKDEEVKEQQKKHDEEKEAQNNKLTADLATFNPKSIDEVAAFVGQFDKLPEADVVTKVKPKVEQMFKSEAADLVMAGEESNLDKINELRENFGRFLSADDMDNLQKETGLKLPESNNKDYSQEFEDYEAVKDNIKTNLPHNLKKEESKNKYAKLAFENFKTNYNNVITNIFSGTTDVKDIIRSITDLENFANDPNNFSKETPEIQAKIRTLCEKMIEMLKEITKAKIMGATDKDTAMKNVSKEHGLDENALGDLLN